MRCKLSPYFSCKFCSECIVTFYDHDAVNASSLRSVVRQPSATCRLCTCDMCCQLLLASTLIKLGIIAGWEFLCEKLHYKLHPFSKSTMRCTYATNLKAICDDYLKVFENLKNSLHTQPKIQDYSFSNDYRNTLRNCEPCYTNLVLLNSCLKVLSYFMGCLFYSQSQFGGALLLRGPQLQLLLWSSFVLVVLKPIWETFCKNGSSGRSL